MTSTLREYSNAFLIIQRTPYMLVKLIVLKFRNHQVTWLPLKLLRRALENELVIVDGFLHFHLLLFELHNCHYLSWFQLSEIGLSSNNSIPLNLNDLTFPLEGNILRPLYRNSPSSFDHRSNKCSSTRDCSCNKTNWSCNVSHQQLWDNKKHTVPSTNWLLWLPYTMSGPVFGRFSSPMIVTSRKKSRIE